MIQKLRTSIPWLGLVLLGFACCLRSAEPASPGNPEDVLARGKGILVKRGELDDVFKRLETELLNSGRFIAPDERESRKAVLLDKMIFNRLVALRATDEDRKAAKETSEKFIQSVIETLGTPEALQRQLLRSGMDDAYFRKTKLEEATVLAVINREVRSKLIIPKADIEKYYNDSAPTFQRRETYKVVHLLIGTRDPATGQDLTNEQKTEKKKLADSLLAKIRAGEDMTALVQKHSDDYKSRAANGILTFVQGQALAELEIATGLLNTGQISEVVSSPYGYHILKLLERKPGGKVPLAEAEPDIRRLLTDRALEKQLPAWADELNADAKIELTHLAPKKPADLIKKK